MIHQSAEVSLKARVGNGTKIWNLAQIREGAQIGENCIISKNVYIDFDVRIGNNVKIQNNVSIYHGTTIEDNVFIGPHVCFTNDKNPRAVNPDGTIKKEEDWKISKILVKEGASIGANSTILPGITIGEFALIGAGSVVTKDVLKYAIVFGNPSRQVGYTCKCGKKLEENKKCKDCGISLSDII